MLEQQQAKGSEAPEPKVEEASEGVTDLDYEAEEDVAAAPLGKGFHECKRLCWHQSLPLGRRSQSLGTGRKILNP